VVELALLLAAQGLFLAQCKGVNGIEHDETDSAIIAP